MWATGSEKDQVVPPVLRAAKLEQGGQYNDSSIEDGWVKTKATAIHKRSGE